MIFRSRRNRARIRSIDDNKKERESVACICFYYLFLKVTNKSNPTMATATIIAVAA